MEEDERFGFVFIIEFHANIYTNLNKVKSFDKFVRKWSYVEIDQSKAAKKNRNILSCFLKELEQLLGMEAGHIESSTVDKKYLYKYGFKEDAILMR